VLTKSLNGILEKARFEHPNFASLDIEGGELTALQSFHFADHRVGVWAFENNTGG
jgi:hypothetical protein